MWPRGHGWTQYGVLGCSGTPQQELYSLFSVPSSSKDILESL